MSNAQVEITDAVAAVSGGQEELKSLLGAIANQIGDVDRRHLDILDDLRARVAALGVQAEQVRHQVPETFVSTFARVEDAMTDLAGRLNQNAGHAAVTLETSFRGPIQPDAQTQAPLRSGVPGDSGPMSGRTADAARLDASVDPFDVVGDVDDAAGPWDAQTAEALTRTYEAVEAGIVRRTRDPEAARASAPAALLSAQTKPESAPLQPAGPIIAEMSRQDRQWLDERLSDIAARIQQSLIDTNPENSFLALGERFEVFEQRFGSALEAVATRSDLEGLRLVEAHISELATHLDHSQERFARLDAIESQLAAVIEHISSLPNQAAPVETAHSDDSLREIANAAAEQTALRIAQSVKGRPDDGRGEELRNLLKSFIDERREGDEQTYAMLDTVQQAMIRILDRVDAIEVTQSRAAPAPQRPAVNPEPTYAVPVVAPAMVAAPAHAAPVAMPEMPSVHAASRTVEPSPIERMRQDFIADAQRARQRASAEPAAPAPKPPRSPISSEDEPARSAKTARDAGPTKVLGVSPKLLVSALATAVAINGALLYLSPSDTPAPAVEHLTEQSAKAPDVVAPAGNTAVAEPDRSMSAEEAITAHNPPEQTPRAGASDTDDTIGMGNVPPSDRPVIEKNSHPADGAAPIIPQGIILQTSPNAPSGAVLAHQQNQQNLAGLSAKVGTAAAKWTPAALINGTATPPAVQASLMDTASIGQSNSADADGQRSSALDLPPATVGPLSLRLAAAKGDPSAEFEVAARLAEGKGTEQNFVEAVRWYQRSAAQGFAQAQYRLGTLYERGLGVKVDIGRARSWYQRAADLGNVKAMHNLAVLSTSKSSTTPDYATAAQWFQKAAGQGLADSQFNLAVLHENGLGVAKDPKLAYKWYTLASTGGDKEALRRRDTLRTQLSPQDLSAAEALVQSFAPATTSKIINDARTAGEDWKKRQQANETGDRN